MSKQGVFEIGGPNFSKGDHVQLGNGDKGTVVRKEERDGFSGYIVKITESKSEKGKKGQQVPASPAGMKRISKKLTAISLSGVNIICEIARTPQEQSIGLQRHTMLENGTGMLFPYNPSRPVKFHMAKVSFPIDMIFVDHKGRVAKVVDSLQPGIIGNWGLDNCSAVVEVPGGFCKQHGIIPLSRIATSRTFDLLRTITEASDDDDDEKEAGPNPLVPGYHSVQPSLYSENESGEQHTNLGGDRFKDRDFGEHTDPNANQMSVKYWQDSRGFDPKNPVFSEGEGEPIRPSAQKVDNGAEFAASLVSFMIEAGDPKWGKDYTTDEWGDELAVITPNDIQSWLKLSGLNQDSVKWMARLASKPTNLRYFADSLIAAGITDKSKVSGSNIILRRFSDPEARLR